jgi:hypothetical protein
MRRGEVAPERLLDDHPPDRPGVVVDQEVLDVADVVVERMHDVARDRPHAPEMRIGAGHRLQKSAGLRQPHRGPDGHRVREKAVVVRQLELVLARYGSGQVEARTEGDLTPAQARP